MKSALKAWAEVEEKFSELTMREKVLSLMSGLVAVLFGGFVWLVEPVQIEIEKLTRDVERQKSQLGQLDRQIQAVELDLKEDF